MAEIITLSAAVDPPRTVFRVSLVKFDWANSHITVQVKEWTGANFGDRTIAVHYTGDIATALMRSLNKANLSTQSLHQRIMTRLLADGKIPSGTASGSPE